MRSALLQAITDLMKIWFYLGLFITHIEHDALAVA